VVVQRHHGGAYLGDAGLLVLEHWSGLGLAHIALLRCVALRCLYFFPLTHEIILMRIEDRFRFDFLCNLNNWLQGVKNNSQIMPLA
jgi:hypothetical protein